MKKFNLEKAMAGEPVVTRNGHEVTQLHLLDCGDDFPLVSVVNDSVEEYTKEGKYINETGESPLDLFMKEETISVNGFEVPKPICKRLVTGDEYYLPGLDRFNFVCCSLWVGDELDLLRFERGIVHTTEEAAIAHAKAMLGINPNN